MEIKLQGNDFYKQQKYDDAVRCYQKAITICPADKKDEMSKFHHNIAAVYSVMVRLLFFMDRSNLIYSFGMLYVHHRLRIQKTKQKR